MALSRPLAFFALASSMLPASSGAVVSLAVVPGAACSGAFEQAARPAPTVSAVAAAVSKALRILSFISEILFFQFQEIADPDVGSRTGPASIRVDGKRVSGPEYRGKYPLSARLGRMAPSQGWRIEPPAWPRSTDERVAARAPFPVTICATQSAQLRD